MRSRSQDFETRSGLGIQNSTLRTLLVSITANSNFVSSSGSKYI